MNLAPQPFFKVKPSQTQIDTNVVLDAGLSDDPDGGPLTVEWDLDDDGEFDTQPSSRRTLDVTFAEPGPRRVRVRLTDDDDGSVGATDLLALLVNWGPCP